MYYIAGSSTHFSCTGLRLISDPGPTDLDEAEALSWMNDVIDIYSNGWGPEDDGRTVLGPGELLQLAMEMSISEVREKERERERCS